VKRAASVVVVLGALAAVAACDDPVSHIFRARQYDPVRGCLGGNVAVDVLEGPDPGSACAPTCLIGRSPLVIGGGGEVIYVTTACPPLPPSFDISGKRPECAQALAALKRADACYVDGGSTNPPVDGGSDAAPDAPVSPDGGADAGDAGNASDASDAGSDAADAADGI
jgi:hypothetical protein